MYNQIFFTNVLRTLKQQKMTQKELAHKTGLSLSFISDICNGQANPSLEKMEKIALVLHTPLSILLENTDLDSETLKELGFITEELPVGYERITAVLPKFRAFQVLQWEKEALRKLGYE